MALHRAHAISLIRALRAFGRLRRRRRVPRQQQPDLIRASYYNAIMPHVQTSFVAFARVRPEIVGLLRAERAEQAHRTDSPRSKQAQALIDRAAAQAADAFAPHQLYATAQQYARRTSEFNRQQLGRQVEAAISVPLSALEPTVSSKLDAFATANVELIKTVPERYFDGIRSTVEAAFDSGTHPDTLAQQLVDRDGVAESDAMRIARDQIGKLNGQLNQERQQQMGVTGYIWRTMNDERVRDEHAEREGEHFEWSEPPEDGHPGEAIQCRCYSEPDFSALLAKDD